MLAPDAVHLEFDAKGDIWLDGRLIIAKHYGYDSTDADVVAAMVEAYNAQAGA